MTDRNGDPAGEADAPGRQSLTRAQVLALAFFVVFAFVVLSVRTEIQQRRISATQAVQAEQQRQIQDNAHRIEVLFFAACTSRHDAAARQVALIDSAIQAERRKPAPDKKRLHDLEQFKPAVESCGPKP